MAIGGGMLASGVSCTAGLGAITTGGPPIIPLNIARFSAIVISSGFLFITGGGIIGIAGGPEGLLAETAPGAAGVSTPGIIVASTPSFATS